MHGSGREMLGFSEGRLERERGTRYIPRLVNYWT